MVSRLSVGLSFCSDGASGERPLAITNVVRSISSFLFMFVNAFASTSSSLVSNLIGSGKSPRSGDGIVWADDKALLLLCCR